VLVRTVAATGLPPIIPPTKQGEHDAWGNFVDFIARERERLHAEREQVFTEIGGSID
jgi:hypothetical protein